MCNDCLTGSKVNDTCEQLDHHPVKKSNCLSQMPPHIRWGLNVHTNTWKYPQCLRHLHSTDLRSEDWLFHYRLNQIYVGGMDRSRSKANKTFAKLFLLFSSWSVSESVIITSFSTCNTWYAKKMNTAWLWCNKINESYTMEPSLLSP